jgi:hypothetical protein
MAAKKLIELRAPHQRFARSINVERDTGSTAIDSYLPTARAIDAVHRLALALDQEGIERALSVTGPYGSGKSSLALLIDALLGPAGDPARAVADDLMASAAPDTARVLAAARQRHKAERSGFVRCLATAQREPIVATVLRALTSGAQRFAPSARQRNAHIRVIERLASISEALSGPQRLRPDSRTVCDAIAAMSGLAPVLLVIDEFGKNLEAFADSRSDADLFLLQELAERTRGTNAIPLALVTMQHMAFDEYTDGASVGQRREWAKIQGRFEDVPFVDSPAQTRALISATFEPCTDPALSTAVTGWAEKASAALRRLGLGEIADVGLVASCWPLHPLALSVLPDLCERFGQNERTLFSFLASREAHSAGAFLAETTWKRSEPLPTVRLHRVYDYFVGSAAALVGVSASATRWIEVDTRIRDASSITHAQRRVVKTVGLLNLVAGGGTLRASRPLVGWAAADGEAGTENEAEVEKRLTELEELGLITWRDFADEYRVWQGSDFDIRSAVDLARRRLSAEPPTRVLEQIQPLAPLVAARHSHESGTLRSFMRRWVDSATAAITPPGPADRTDGLVLYVLDELPSGGIEGVVGAKPVVAVTAPDTRSLVEAATEAAAVQAVLDSDDGLADDWVAKRELAERVAEAQSALQVAFEATFGASVTDTSWQVLGQDGGWLPIPVRGGSPALSWVADNAYPAAPRVRNDMLNRYELTSQGAKARRMLIEAMLVRPSEKLLGMDGFGPERAMYESILATPRIHVPHAGAWRFTRPSASSSYRPAWDEMVNRLDGAKRARLRVSELLDGLAAPPYGMRAGLASVLLTAVLIAHSDEVALYEHGTYKPALTPELFERLVRNPAHFEVKHFATRSGPRRDLIERATAELGGPSVRAAGPSVLRVVSQLVQVGNSLPQHVRKTRHLSEDAVALRQAILTATEPDQLLFSDIPMVLGFEPVPPTGRYSAARIGRIVERLASLMGYLSDAYPGLLLQIRHAVADATAAPPARLRSNLTERAGMLDGKVLDPKLRTFTAAVSADLDDEEGWTEYVAMTVSGAPPQSWSDDDRARFFVQLREVGGILRRLEALNHEQLAADRVGFEAVRVTVTSQSGHESARVVWVDPALREALSPLVDEVVQRAKDVAGNGALGRDLLLALLAEQDSHSADPRADGGYREGDDDNLALAGEE